MQMNIDLSPQLESMVREKVRSGLYTSPGEVVREALRLMAEQDHQRAAKLDRLRLDIQAGLDSGPATPLNLDEAKAEGRRRRAERLALGEGGD
jgi:antitoxin ParD1/3/4